MKNKFNFILIISLMSTCILSSCKTAMQVSPYGENLPKDIDQLIIRIHNYRKVSFTFVRETESSLPWFYEGEIYAWHIEYCLNNKFSPKNVITKNGQFFSLDNNDIDEIQRLYKVWWNKNKNLPLYLIRIKRVFGDNAFNNTIYEWKKYQ